MDKKDFDKFLVEKTMKENNPKLIVPKKSGTPKKESQKIIEEDKFNKKAMK